MVLLEAMNNSKATVISDVAGSGMGWVVQHNITGLKVPPKDVEKLATALLNLQRDRAKMRAMGEQGRRRFDQEFHINQSAAGVAEVYHKLTPTG